MLNTSDAAFVLASVLVVASMGMNLYVFRKITDDSRAVVVSLLADLRAVTQRALILQGLNPHVVDPETFGPSGMARADELKHGLVPERPGPTPNTAQVEPLSEQDDDLREAEREFFAMRGRLTALDHSTAEEPITS